MKNIITIPSKLTNRILVDPPEVQNFLLSYWPHCLLDIKLTPVKIKEIPFTASLNVTTNEIEIVSTNLKDRGFYNFELTFAPRPPFNYGLNAKQSFQIELVNLCETANFED